MNGDFASTVIIYIAVGYGLLFLHLYIFRSIFNIPTFLKYQKAQIKLLEAMAKRQGVDDKAVTTIVSESFGWNEYQSQNTTGTAEPQA